MDEIVRQAMVKWPNVPHCFGWLALDARGHWRMRDEAAQQQNLPGDKIMHTALLGFINRNYEHDAEGRWYFQNGPQRVYVNLEATPFIARTDAQHGLLLHTGASVTTLDAVYLTEAGQLLVQSGEQVALLDDRDLSRCLTLLQIDGRPVDDHTLLDWLSAPHAALHFIYQQQKIAVACIASSNLPERFGYVPRPQPD